MRSSVYKKIGHRIRELRDERKLTQEKLALESELNRAYIGYIERGERRPSVETIEKIAKVLKVDLHELFKF
jgi:transcriptional regulator with XRE-family HTH domain